jgi:hypothetical protein
MAQKTDRLGNSTALARILADLTAVSLIQGETAGQLPLPAVQYVDTQVVARILNLKPQTLAKWRWSGRGPPYTKLNGAVRYALSDVLAFVQAGKRRSTSDAGPPNPLPDSEASNAASGDPQNPEPSSSLPAPPTKQPGRLRRSAS